VAFNYVLYTVRLELQIPFGIQRNDTKQFWCLRHIWWESLQMSYGRKIGTQNYFLNESTNMFLQGHSWYVQGEYKGVKNHPSCCVHIGGAFHTTVLHLNSFTKSNHRLFVIGAYKIWCRSYELLTMTCFGCVDLIKLFFLRIHDIMCDYLWNLNSSKLVFEHD
jgi:hypothetical protein